MFFTPTSMLDYVGYGIYTGRKKIGNKGTEILNQAQGAFFHSFSDVHDGTPKNIDRYCYDFR